MRAKLGIAPNQDVTLMPPITPVLKETFQLSFVEHRASWPKVGLPHLPFRIAGFSGVGSESAEGAGGKERGEQRCDSGR